MEVLDGHFSGHREGGARRFHFFQIPWRRCQRRDVFECSSYMDPSWERRSSHVETRKIARDNLQADFYVTLTRQGTWSGLQSIRVFRELDSCFSFSRNDYRNYEYADLSTLGEDCFHTGRKLCVKCLDERAWALQCGRMFFYLLQEMVAHQSINLSCSRQWIPWPDWLLPCLTCRNSSCQWRSSAQTGRDSTILFSLSLGAPGAICWVPWIRFRVSHVHRIAPVGTNVCSSVWILEERSFSRKRRPTTQSNVFDVDTLRRENRHCVRASLVMAMKFSKLRRQSVDLTIRLSVMIAGTIWRFSSFWIVDRKSFTHFG